MTPRQIYVVDDNPEFRDSLRFWLEGFGCQVRDWGDPRDALQSLARVAVGTPWPESTCLMLDVRMPELSGLDLHDALRERGVEVELDELEAKGIGFVCERHDIDPAELEVQDCLLIYRRSARP